MPSIGSVTFIPNARFAFPRSYVDQIRIDNLYTPFTHVRGFYTSTISAFPGNHAYLMIRDKFWDWSSNNFTLDYIVTQAYSVNDATLVEAPTNITVRYRPASPSLPSAIEITVTGFGAGLLDGGLPPRNVPYWLPDAN